MVACDGLWDVCDDQDAVNLVLDGIRELQERPPNDQRAGIAEVLARMLVEEALARGSTDNVTCIVLFL